MVSAGDTTSLPQFKSQEEVNLIQLGSSSSGVRGCRSLLPPTPTHARAYTHTHTHTHTLLSIISSLEHLVSAFLRCSMKSPRKGAGLGADR